MYEDRILQLLARKVAGEATDAELTELNALLEQYPDSLYYEEILKQLWDQQPADDIDVEAAYLKHREQYEDDFETEAKPSFYSRIFTIQRIMVAAIMLLIAAAGFYFYQATDNTEKTKSRFSEVTTTKGMRKKIVLPDGTQVWLNGSSKIVFDNDMNTSPTRLVKLIGEAYFDVTKNKQRPFVIHTDKFSIRVLGTAFNVKAYPGEKKTEATLIRGMIELTINDSLQEKFILRPNEKFAMAYSKPQVEAANANNIPAAQHRKLVIEDIKPVEIASKQYIEETSWVDNKLVFKNESLEELVPELERWYNVKITIDNDKAKNYHFTGVFQYETITQALTYMQIIRPFTFKIDKNDVKIN